MKLLKVGAAVLNQTPLAWEENSSNIRGAIAEARAQGVGALCLPELCISGYGCEDAFLSPGSIATAWDVLEEILPDTAGMIVSLGLPVRHRNALFNCACLAVDGRIAGLVGKRYLAGDGLHYEPRWFKPWPRGQDTELVVAGRRYPLGDLYFDCGGVSIGFEICEDAWVATRTGGSLATQGVDLVLNPSASHFAFGKQEIRLRYVLEGSRAFAASYVYSNLLGNEAGRAIYDGGALIASSGKLLAAGPRFSYAPFLVTTAVVDLDLTRMHQARLASYQPELKGTFERRVEVAFEPPEAAPEVISLHPAAWEESEHRKEEEFTRAVSLALFDYLRKSRTRGFVVSSSGGADSSAVACLVATMVQLAWNELGPSGLRERLAHLGNLVAEGSAPRDLVARLLTCVYQSTRNSSEMTRSAAREVAAAVGAGFVELDVDSVVEAYVGLVSQAIGRGLTWERDDVALQNIQARTRAPSAWLLANLRGALLLATSNRSEAAVGYATMDGDTCGGLSPIAGIDKAFLRRWLSWMERWGADGLEPIPALSHVNALQPTAELRPPEERQTDEQDLMPYDLLDAIERMAIRDKRVPLEVFELLSRAFPQHPARRLAEWVERFFRLWCGNQWKRERYAPSFHLDDENLDPKTWCRFPILSGGFARELEELRAYVRELERRRRSGDREEP